MPDVVSEVPTTSEFDDDVAAVGRIQVVARILDVVCRTTGMGFAAVARVTEDRWIACGVDDRIGFGVKPVGELKVETTICRQVRNLNEAVIIDDVSADAVYCNHPTPALYGFQSYISIPIVLGNGSFFGTLCAIDPHPAPIKSAGMLETLKLFAELIALHLDGERRVAAAEASLLDERQTSELREQFIAVLGHDLRNPLAAIDAGTRLLMRQPLEARATRIVTMMQSSVTRMSALINDVLDFARGRLGNGLTVSLDSPEPLEPVLNHVVAELQAAWPGRSIEVTTALQSFVCCDHTRIGQLFSNLLANALAYGAADRPVRVHAASDPAEFVLSVSNAGDPIAPATLGRLFQPFSRGGVWPNQAGLGLGLYIAHQIASAHGGTLVALSTPAETRFTFRMPCVSTGNGPH